MKIDINKEFYFSNCNGVFQGGGCKAVAYIGAYEVAYNHGIMFSELAGTSAGSIIAAAIALGATPDDIKKFIYNLDFKSLVKVSEAKYDNIPILDFFDSLLSNNDKNKKIKKKKEKKVNKKTEENNQDKDKDKDKDKNQDKDLKDSEKEEDINKGNYISSFISLKKLKIKSRFAEKFIYGKLKKSDSLFWKNFDHNRMIHEYGLFDTGVLRDLLSDWFSKLANIYDPKFKDLPVKLHVLAGNVPGHTLMVFSQDTTPDFSIAEAVTASCSIPFFFAPPQKKFIDGGVLSNRPDILIENQTEYFRTLSFSLTGRESKINNLMDFTSSIVDTIINGADEIQHKDNSAEKVEIDCHDFKATDFNKMEKENVDKLIDYGRTAMNSFFMKLNKDDDRLGMPHRHLHSMEQVYAQVAYWGYKSMDSIVVISEDLDWVWILFPSVVGWCNHKASLKVYYSNLIHRKNRLIDEYKEAGKSSTEAEKKFQKSLIKQEAIKRFLHAIGAEVVDCKNELPPSGYYFTTGYKYKAIIYDKDGEKFKGKIYADDLDSYALKNIMPETTGKVLKKMALNLDRDQVIIDSLRKIKMYKTADFEWKTMNVEALRFLNKFIRGDKYKQIYNMFNLYPESGDIFSGSSIALHGDRESIIGPIVVEKHGDNYFVIEGNTRALFAYKNNISKLKVLVVKNVKANLPLDMQANPDGFSIDKVLISEKGREGEDRYNGFNYSLFRPIEQTLRPDSEYLVCLPSISSKP